MSDHFDVTVQYKGKEMHFEVQPVITGYTYRFLVTVHETDIIFERDEEGNYRALKAPSSMESESKDPDVNLLMGIQQQIELMLE